MKNTLEDLVFFSARFFKRLCFGSGFAAVQPKPRWRNALSFLILTCESLTEPQDWDVFPGRRILQLRHLFQIPRQLLPQSLMSWI